MIPLQRLAFVDLETSGLSPTIDRITEIGLVTVDDHRVTEWTTLVNPRTRISRRSRLFDGIADEVVADTPRFQDIAADLPSDWPDGFLLLTTRASTLGFCDLSSGASASSFSRKFCVR